MQFADLLSKVSYLPPHDVDVLSRAYDAAASAHHDQNRLSGEKFIEHPLSVAGILADLQLDRDTLAAAILHDTVEDTHLTISDLEQSFGPTVGKLVAGVTKLEKISFHSQEQAQAENVRKMLVAMAEDVRVVLMKLADRLHNMRTVNYLPENRRRARNVRQRHQGNSRKGVDRGRYPSRDDRPAEARVQHRQQTCDGQRLR